MTFTQIKTLKLREKKVKSGLRFNQKVVDIHARDVGKTLDHQNVQMVGEQRRRVNYPHDDGS